MGSLYVKKGQLAFSVATLLVVALLISGAAAQEEPALPEEPELPSDGGGGFMAPFFNAIKNLATDTLIWIIKTLEAVLRWNPTVYPLYVDADGNNVCDHKEGPNPTDCALPAISRLIVMMLLVLMPLYQIFILYYGLMIIWWARNPRQRAQYKDRLKRFLAGMVFVSLSPMIFQVFLDIESLVVTNVLDIAITYLAAEGIDAFLDSFIPGMVILIIVAVIIKIIFAGLPVIPIMLFLMTPILLMVLRYVLVMVFAVIFPLTMFFYTFEFTRGLGQKLFKTSIMWIFMPVISAVFFALFFLSADVSGSVMGIAWILLMLFMLSYYPMQVTGMLGHVGGAIAASGMSHSSPKRVILGNWMRGAPIQGALMAGGEFIGMGKASHTPSSGIHKRRPHPRSGGATSQPRKWFMGAGAAGGSRMAYEDYKDQLMTGRDRFDSKAYTKLKNAVDERLTADGKDKNDIRERSRAERDILSKGDDTAKDIKKTYHEEKKQGFVSPKEQRFFELRMAGKSRWKKTKAVGKFVGHQVFSAPLVPVGRVIGETATAVYAPGMPGGGSLKHIGQALGGSQDGERWKYGGLGRLVKDSYNKWKTRPLKYGLQAGIGLSVVGSVFTPIFLPAAVAAGLGASLLGVGVRAGVVKRRQARGAPPARHRAVEDEKQQATRKKVDEYNKKRTPETPDGADFFQSREYQNNRDQYHSREQFDANQRIREYAESDAGKRFEGEMTGVVGLERKAGKPAKERPTFANLAVDFDRVGIPRDADGVHFRGPQKKAMVDKLGEVRRADLVAQNEHRLDKDTFRKLAEGDRAMGGIGSLTPAEKHQITGLAEGTGGLNLDKKSRDDLKRLMNGEQLDKKDLKDLQGKVRKLDKRGIDQRVDDFKHAANRMESLNLIDKGRKGNRATDIIRFGQAHAALDGVSRRQLRRTWTKLDPAARDALTNEAFTGWNSNDVLKMTSQQRSDYAMEEYFADHLEGLPKDKKDALFGDAEKLGDHLKEHVADTNQTLADYRKLKDTGGANLSAEEKVDLRALEGQDIIQTLEKSKAPQPEGKKAAAAPPATEKGAIDRFLDLEEKQKHRGFEMSAEDKVELRSLRNTEAVKDFQRFADVSEKPGFTRSAEEKIDFDRLGKSAELNNDDRLARYRAMQTGAEEKAPQKEKKPEEPPEKRQKQEREEEPAKPVGEPEPAADVPPEQSPRKAAYKPFDDIKRGFDPEEGAKAREEEQKRATEDDRVADKFNRDAESTQAPLEEGNEAIRREQQTAQEDVDHEQRTKQKEAAKEREKEPPKKKRKSRKKKSKGRRKKK